MPTYSQPLRPQPNNANKLAKLRLGTQSLPPTPPLTPANPLVPWSAGNVLRRARGLHPFREIKIIRLCTKPKLNRSYAKSRPSIPRWKARPRLQKIGNGKPQTPPLCRPRNNLQLRLLHPLPPLYAPSRPHRPPHRTPHHLLPLPAHHRRANLIQPHHPQPPPLHQRLHKRIHAPLPRRLQRARRTTKLFCHRQKRE